MVQASLQNCPSSKIVMAGYSQGGQLVHNAAKQLPAVTMAQVNSVVIFGDPGTQTLQNLAAGTSAKHLGIDDGTPVTGIATNKQKIICHVGDDICAHGDLVLAAHLTYSKNAGEAATFVAAAAQLAVG